MDDKSSIILSARILQRRKYKNYHESTWYEITGQEGFAFDHAKIIVCALLNLQ